MTVPHVETHQLAIHFSRWHRQSLLCGDDSHTAAVQGGGKCPGLHQGQELWQKIAHVWRNRYQQTNRSNMMKHDETMLRGQHTYAET